MWIEQSEIEKFFPALNLRVCHSQELFCPFPALLLVSPYKGVEVSSSCHGASHLYSGLCRLLFLPLQEFRGPSPFQICGQETRSKLMEKFFFCSWFSRVWRDGARTRTCQRAGRGDGELPEHTQPGCLSAQPGYSAVWVHSPATHTRSDKATAGRRQITPRSARDLILEGPEHTHPLLKPQYLKSSSVP